MRHLELTVAYPFVNKENLVALTSKIPSAWIELKIAALLLVLEGRRTGCIGEVLSLTCMSLHRWVDGVHEDGVAALSSQPRPFAAYRESGSQIVGTTPGTVHLKIWASLRRKKFNWVILVVA